MAVHLALTTLIWCAVGLPLLLALAWVSRGLRRLVIVAAPWAALPALGLAGVHVLSPGIIPPVEAPVFFLGLRMGVDAVGGAILILTAFIWTAAGIYARTYHRDDPRRDAFFAFFAATMAGNIGLVLAGDLLSFYVAFAIMTFAAWGLVIHDGTLSAFRAGRIYIALALGGEVAILAALFSLGAAGGGGVLLGFDVAEAWAGLGDRAPWVAGLAVAGFGVKAGLVPLHLWLPLAHPVAPTAASALLSGVMIKAGLLGWLRILPPGGEALMPGVGGALVMVGVVGAIYGVVVGLAQDDPKTLLAYSSVSQMGYMSVGVGLVVLLPEIVPFVLGAVLLYALHHGVAKAALFLAVGVAARLPGDQDARGRSAGPGRVAAGKGTGGPARRWRWTLRLGVALPALALAGAPLTSGALAKEILKGGLGELGGIWYAVLDPLLILAAFGTTLLMMRFVILLDGRVTKRHVESGSDDPDRAPWGLVTPWALVVLASASSPIWLIGVVPLPMGFETALGRPLPGILDAGLAALLPVLAGVLMAWWITVTPGRVAWVANVRIPAGDLLIPLEAGLRLFPRSTRALNPVAEGGRRILEAIGDQVRRRVPHLDRDDLIFMRSPVLGGTLFGLLLLLVLALRGGSW